MNWRNAEGFKDPTAGQAIENVIRERKRAMELNETIEMMQSDDYKERFKAEYYQTKIRYQKLKAMVENWDNLAFIPTCSKEFYLMQLDIMKAYLGVLRFRARQEQVEL